MQFIHAIVTAVLLSAAQARFYNFSNEVVGGEVPIQYISDDVFDAPKVDALNGSTYDWWYFDAVSTTTNASVVLVLYRATPGRFPYVLDGSTASVNLFITSDNGTSQYYPIANLPGRNGEVIISTDGQGASGVWESTGFSFFGSADLSSYTVHVNSPALGLNGTLSLSLNAPAHYPCGPNEPGQNLLVSPHVGWANAMPDADAVASFTIKGEDIQFTGVGYHDKNWGDQLFSDHVVTWYWGHGRLGPYSLVWFDVLHPSGRKYVSGYVARDGEVVENSCDTEDVQVQPFGPMVVSPSASDGSSTDGFTVAMELEDGPLRVTVKNRATIVPGKTYRRWLGSMSGGIVDETQYEGVGIWEEFIML
ncbi:hypothetical protein P170DRAFT_478209 [Aspergillus steynii IBT 23096]|uniref:Hydroxyneurosporene synthase n=1 Tax=Aspergillus steynii IBT 23096 TaxID=1392250 RepID=A0A2I2G3C4_9EURO|nr:uncharacterized protein P170DRAFT_478209 [Aspergillus steynii IBT 23096]PLB47357.1 hypothetical protein P170DRAFT_478209 [Aspergillus steynii IBT 23096]